jgi:tetratricopeptide (TPR) repeat protein
MGRFDNLEIQGKGLRSKGEPDSGRILYDVDRFMHMAQDYYLAGDYEPSLRYYSKALQENVSLDDAWFGQVICLIQLQEYKEALIWVDKALDKFPQSTDLIAAKAYVYSKLGDSQRALDFSDGALNLKADSEFAWIARGAVLLSINRKNADRCLTKAVEKSSADWKTLMAVADVYREGKHYRDALRHYLQAVDKQPDNAKLWLMIGDCRRCLGFGNAKDAFDQAFHIRPDWEEGKRLANRKSDSIIVKLVRRLFRRR